MVLCEPARGAHPRNELTGIGDCIHLRGAARPTFLDHIERGHELYSQWTNTRGLYSSHTSIFGAACTLQDEGCSAQHTNIMQSAQSWSRRCSFGVALRFELKSKSWRVQPRRATCRYWQSARSTVSGQDPDGRSPTQRLGDQTNSRAETRWWRIVTWSSEFGRIKVTLFDALAIPEHNQLYM